EALDQARREGTFTADHEAFWTAAKAATDEASGTRCRGTRECAQPRTDDAYLPGHIDQYADTRELIQVLLLHRHMRGLDVTAGIRSALRVGAATADVVAVEARKAAQDAGRSPTFSADPPAPPPPPPDPPPVTERTLQRVAQLPADHRPPPDLHRWDQLLHHRRKESS
ncbi:MAG: hypothetical protein SYR96_39805, partial [Actinomycetota bacterium]|nr:hypothetical protein [Actinomycetota bacterium]